MYWNVYTIPIIATAVILIILFFLLINLKKSKGAALFSLVVICFFVYTVGYGLVISAKSIDTAINFFYIERIGGSLIPSFYLIFAVSFIEKYNLLHRRFLPIYFIIPVVSIIMLITNSSHFLFFSNPSIGVGRFYNEFTYKPELWYYIQQFYILFGSLVVNVILITLFINGTSIYKKQIASIVIGSLALLILHTLLHPNMLGLFNLNINPTPYFSSYAGIIIYIGLRRYNLFRFVPIVRDTIFEKMADAVIVIDKEKVVVDLNENAMIYLNLQKKDVGRRVDEVITFWHKLGCNEDDVDTRHDYVYKTEIYDVAAYYQINISPYFDKNDTFQGQIIVVRDITVQKDAERVLDSQSRLINTMLNHLPIGIFMVEAKTGKPLLVNTKAKELIGRGILPDANSENLSEVYQAYISGTNTRYPPERMPIILGMKGESAHINDLEVERPDGTRIQIEIFGCPVYDSSGEVYASLVGFLDITDRKIAEKKIQSQNRELKELNATKDKFFSIIAHDLKNPINAILGFSQLLQNEINNLEKEEIIDFSSVIYNSTLHTSKLLENLLEWSSIQRGRTEFAPKIENFQDILLESLEPILASAINKSITLKIPETNGLQIFVDRRMISSVIRNIVTNAIKFTPKKGTIEINPVVTEGYLKVFITDTGIGMDKDILENLFKIEAKIHRSGTEGEPSTGLGLLLCKEFVEKHNGVLWATSKVGKGSTFCFSLPIAFDSNPN